MKPGFMMVIDPRPSEASVTVAGMLESLQAIEHPQLTAAKGSDWAAATIAPPVKLPHCGADIYKDQGDILIWAGDLFVPDDWSCADNEVNPQRAISRSLLQHLRTHGIDILAKLEGAFCGAWYDHARNRWAVFNDRFGLLPVFWSVFGNRLVIGPTAWLTWQGSGLPLTIDADGVADVLRTLNVTEDRTLIKDVHWLVGGHVLFCNAAALDSCHTHCYWEFRHRPCAFHDPSEAMDAYVDGLARTLKRQTADVSSLLLGISGGMDSRMILAVCDSMGILPSCFSAGWPFNEDVRFGRRLARVAKAAFTFVSVDTETLHEKLNESVIETDGLHGAGHMGISVVIPGFLNRHTNTVLLEGYMLGILGGSYVPDDDDVPVGCAPHQCRWATGRLHDGGDIDLINNLLRTDLSQTSLKRWQAQIDDRYERAATDDPLERAEYAIVSGRSGRIDALGLNAYRHHVAVRSPGTARELLDFWAGTPATWRRGKQLYMDILRQRYPQFAQVPRANCNNLPISASAWRREYHWQSQKLYRLWARCRYPKTNTWGLSGGYKNASVFTSWQNGGLRQIFEPDARVCEWISKTAMNALWQQAIREPHKATPLLALGTIETMVRFLEELKPLPKTLSRSAISRTNEIKRGVLLCASS